MSSWPATSECRGWTTLYIYPKFDLCDTFWQKNPKVFSLEWSNTDRKIRDNAKLIHDQKCSVLMGHPVQLVFVKTNQARHQRNCSSKKRSKSQKGDTQTELYSASRGIEWTLNRLNSVSPTGFFGKNSKTAGEIALKLSQIWLSAPHPISMKFSP